ncbi:unnamed protein product [Mytilus coruscus]|uniref:Reverse transcriptase domain-containing protein n=1 Tax=Mytilus coruscus TaxID=42192 RepID=A0A6J7ZVH5_MYTCO|nr:unnamed protein product [Mytilus coruscus]
MDRQFHERPATGCSRHRNILHDTSNSRCSKGNVFGPTLFLISINDIPDGITSPIILFANDCVINRHKESNEEHFLLQKDQSPLVQWSGTWHCLPKVKERAYQSLVWPKLRYNTYPELITETHDHTDRADTAKCCQICKEPVIQPREINQYNINGSEPKLEHTGTKSTISGMTIMDI